MLLNRSGRGSQPYRRSQPLTIVHITVNCCFVQNIPHIFLSFRLTLYCPFTFYQHLPSIHSNPPLPLPVAAVVNVGYAGGGRTGTYSFICCNSWDPSVVADFNFSIDFNFASCINARQAITHTETRTHAHAHARTQNRSHTRLLLAHLLTFERFLTWNVRPIRTVR